MSPENRDAREDQSDTTAPPVTSPEPGEPQQASATAPATESAAPAPLSVAPPAAAERPKPAYGEYAPEGWSWTPPGSEGDAAGATAAAPALGAGASRVAPSVTGVPHNLGARGTTPPVAPSGAPQHAPASTPSTPQLGAADGHYRAEAPAGVPNAPKRGMADRIFSILLLVCGAFGAFQLGAALFTMPDTFNLFASAAQLEDFTVPEALRTAGNIGAISILAIYACNLILTIQRLRAGKLAFWVPLVACVAAIIVMFVTMVFALSVTPELIEFLSNPDSMSILMEQLSTTTTP